MDGFIAPPQLINEEGAYLRVEDAYAYRSDKRRYVHSAEVACQEACSLDEICTGVSFNPDWGRCVTKQAPCLCPSMGSDTFYERVAVGKTIASANEVSPITSYISLGDGMDCRFNDIRTCDGRTDEQCQGLCDLDSECFGVSHRASDGRCVTKSESCAVPLPGDHTFYVKP